MSVFVRRDQKVKPNFSVAVLMNKKGTKGKVGLEIEVEGKKLPHEDDTPSPWLYHHDGSLRGQDNGEYVLAKPMEFSEIGGALDTLWETFSSMKSVLDDSNRTSVHVHLNCQDFHLNRLTSFLALWFTMEEVLTAWCGEHRVGNLFCLRAVDAPAIVTRLKSFIRSDGSAALPDCLHYSGLNAHALSKFGSLEVRMLRGCSDPQTIKDWVEILEKIYTLSAEFPDPRDICGLFSSEGPLAFFEKILGDKVGVVRSAIDWTDEQVRESMYQGVRMAQDLCYCRDWDVFNPVELKPDPFGRGLAKVAKKMMSAQINDAQAAMLDSLNAVSDDWAGPDEMEVPPDDFPTMPAHLQQAPPTPAPHAGTTLSWTASASVNSFNAHFDEE